MLAGLHNFREIERARPVISWHGNLVTVQTLTYVWLIVFVIETFWRGILFGGLLAPVKLAELNVSRTNLLSIYSITCMYRQNMQFILLACTWYTLHWLDWVYLHCLLIRLNQTLQIYVYPSLSTLLMLCSSSSPPPSLPPSLPHTLHNYVECNTTPLLHHTDHTKLYHAASPLTIPRTSPIPNDRNCIQ